MGNSFVGGMINGVAQPVLVQSVADKDRQRNMFRKMVRFGAFISFPLMFGFAFVAKEFVLIFLGEKWSSSVLFLQIFCCWGAFWYLQSLYTNLLISHGKSDLYLYGVVINSTLQLLFIVCFSYFGIYFMVVGFVIANVIGLLLWHIIINRVVSINLFSVIKDIISIFCINFGFNYSLPLCFVLHGKYFFIIHFENSYCLCFIHGYYELWKF